MNDPQTAIAPGASPPSAKPRKSRRWWYVVACVLVLLAIPVAWYFIAGWLGEREMQALYAELDAEDPNWRWPDLAAKLQPVPGEENSVDQILKVSTLAAKPTAFMPGPKWDRTNFAPNARLTHEQAEAGRLAFSRSDPTLRDEARKLKDMPRGKFVIPIKGNPLTMDFSDIQRSRETCNVLYVDALLRAQDGDLDGAAESCQAILNTAGAFRHHPILIGYLVRVAEQAIAIGAIERLLAQGTVAEPHLKKLQDQLEREAN
ncbi:MAG TPA: PIG-Y family protein, partial [Gemmataceae bacterium]|nr:PIG-Y family protein [Gemmataceae bacterium]